MTAKTARRIMLTASYIGMLPAVLFVFMPFYLLYQSSNVDKAKFLLNEGVEISGSIVDKYVEEYSDSSDEYYVQYVFSIDNSEYDHWFKVKYSQYRRYKVGNDIPILYDTMDRSYFMAVDEANNTIEDYNFGWKIWPYAGLIAFMAGLLYYWGYRIEPVNIWSDDDDDDDDDDSGDGD